MPIHTKVFSPPSACKIGIWLFNSDCEPNVIAYTVANAITFTITVTGTVTVAVADAVAVAVAVTIAHFITYMHSCMLTHFRLCKVALLHLIT